ncbi:MAG: hypothetical protein JO043_11675 [Candidatus Eremiobacteraeota bacterium]|nr:hypothetical protein [Candidatus Eremiobacteraeota bacterium]
MTAGRAAAVLRAVDATFVRDGVVLVPPFSVEVYPGQHISLKCPDGRAASIAARMAAGIVKATSGTLLIGDFDPRIQPVQVKRFVGYVTHSEDFGWVEPRPAPGSATSKPYEVDSLRRQAAIEMQAALSNVPRREALRRVRATLDRIGWRDTMTFAVALAFIRAVKLLVLDRPPAHLANRVCEVFTDEAVLFCSPQTSEVPSAALVHVS